MVLPAVLVYALLLTVHTATCQQPDILAGAIIAQAADSVYTMVNAGGDLIRSLVPTVRLPQCEKSGILTTGGGFPDDWATLSAAQQAGHPINLPMMQLAYTAYQSPETFSTCVQQWGVDNVQVISKTVPEFLSNTVAHVIRIGQERLFVVFKGSDATNWMQDMQCAHTQSLGHLFGASNSDLRLHSGFYAGWTALEKDVTAAVLSFAKEAPQGKVYFVGHSLGAALASIAALQLSFVLPPGNEVAGVWLLGSPRVGNPTWKSMYNAMLQHKTLRISNHLDFATRVPHQQQACSNTGGIFNLLAPTSQFAYAHVGRSLMMCPGSTGMGAWTVSGMGSEVVDCPDASTAASESDATGATHLLGSYFDSWRRGYYASRGTSLADDARVKAVLCEDCTMRRGLPLAQIAVPARAGGPVTCTVDASCTSQVAWNAVTAVQQVYTAGFSELSVCTGFICSQIPL